MDDDLMEMGKSCCPNRVAHLGRRAGIQAHIGYKGRPGQYGGKPSLAIDNTLDGRFDVDTQAARNGMPSPVEFGRQHKKQAEGI